MVEIKPHLMYHYHVSLHSHSTFSLPTINYRIMFVDTWLKFLVCHYSRVQACAIYDIREVSVFLKLEEVKVLFKETSGRLMQFALSSIITFDLVETQINECLIKMHLHISIQRCTKCWPNKFMHIAICNTFFDCRQINFSLKSNIVQMVHLKNCSVIIIEDLPTHDRLDRKLPIKMVFTQITNVIWDFF
jgi:hypothetical protein